MNDKKTVEEELLCEALKKGYTMRYRALGGSMNPFIRSGSILTVKPYEGISVGDVILYKNSDGLIAHRVIKKKKVNGRNFFITKGDNLRYIDGVVYDTNILGKVIELEKDKRVKMNSLFRRLVNYFIAISSPFILPGLFSFLRKTKKAFEIAVE
jgi:signal peptidase I